MQSLTASIIAEEERSFDFGEKSMTVRVIDIPAVNHTLVITKYNHPNFHSFTRTYDSIEYKDRLHRLADALSFAQRLVDEFVAGAENE